MVSMTAVEALTETTGLRTILAAAVAGALGMGIIAGATGFGEGDSTEAAETTTVAPDEDGVVAFTAAEEGSCLTWQTDEEGTISNFQETSCDGEHRFEVAARENLKTYPTSEFGPDAQPPNPTRQAQLREELCQTASIRYLDGRYDPSGRYSIAPILPPVEAWESGDRTMLCGLQETDSEGTPMLTTGRAAEQDQARVAEPGQCLVTDEANNLHNVDCGEPHHIEVTEKVDLAPVFPDRSPSADDQNKYLGDVCAKAAENYLGSEENLYQTTLQIYWGTSPYQAWDGGSRSVNCGLISAKGDHFASVTGSAKGGRDALKVDGETPKPPPERRPLRENQMGSNPVGVAPAPDQ